MQHRVGSNDACRPRDEAVAVGHSGAERVVPGPVPQTWASARGHGRAGMAERRLRHVIERPRMTVMARCFRIDMALGGLGHSPRPYDWVRRGREQRNASFGAGSLDPTAIVDLAIPLRAHGSDDGAAAIRTWEIAQAPGSDGESVQSHNTYRRKFGMEIRDRSFIGGDWLPRERSHDRDSLASDRGARRTGAEAVEATSSRRGEPVSRRDSPWPAASARGRTFSAISPSSRPQPGDRRADRSETVARSWSIWAGVAGQALDFYAGLGEPSRSTSTDRHARPCQGPPPPVGCRGPSRRERAVVITLRSRGVPRVFGRDEPAHERHRIVHLAECLEKVACRRAA